MPQRTQQILAAIGFCLVFGLLLTWFGIGADDLAGPARFALAVLLGLVPGLLLYSLLRHRQVRDRKMHDLDRLHSEREDFNVRISHEIRTPLTGILGVMHLLNRTQLDRDQQRYVDTATNSANMLLTIITDIFDDSRTRTGGIPIESESFDPSEVIEDVASILAPEAIAKGLELVCVIDPGIPQRARGDALRLRQVLNNLVNNAIKFTGQGNVVLYASVNETSIRIGVEDSGVGIDPELCRQLLQGGSKSARGSGLEAAGAGLGIDSCRRLIKAMGSELRIESSVGEGSDFHFELALEDDLKEAYDWNPPQAMQDLSIGILSPLELRRTGFRKILTYWGIKDFRELDYDAESAQELPDMLPCDLLIVDQSETEQAVNDIIDRLRNQSEWRETRFIHLLPLTWAREGGSADIRVHKPIALSRLYSALMDIVYQLAFNSEYDSAAGDVGKPAGILAGKRILLAEDNDINKMIVLEMLEETGVLVDVADNGLQAVQQIQNDAYDLLLMDIQMPELDGIEATRQIRALGGDFTTLPIIAMTAHALEGDSSKSLEAGMDYHISKPFEPDKFIAVIQRFIEQSDSR